MPQIQEVIRFLETKAPRSYQESYDNAGLLTGDAQQEIKGILYTLDATEEVIEEAISKQCNFIIAHHPVIFKGLKSITGKNHVERAVIKAIKNDIAIYATHTNLDNVHDGVNYKIGQKLGLEQLAILKNKPHSLNKLTTFVPQEDAEKVLNALSDAGAGNIGNYKNCSFTLDGQGTFQPNEFASPHIGTQNQLEKVDEKRIEVIFPAYVVNEVMKALNEAHPYEEVAYYLHNLENDNQEAGSGMTGKLPEPMSAESFLRHIKSSMEVHCIRHTKPLDRQIKKVAVCGGAGSFLLGDAIRSGADAFITSDFKYHEFFDADGEIMIADIGHYESEQYTRELLREWVQEQYPQIKGNISQINTNPIQYS